MRALRMEATSHAGGEGGFRGSGWAVCWVIDWQAWPGPLGGLCAYCVVLLWFLLWMGGTLVLLFVLFVMGPLVRKNFSVKNIT